MGDPILERLHALGQEHLAKDLKSLSIKEREQFFSQLTRYDSNILRMQRTLLHQAHPAAEAFEPLKDYSRSGSEENRRLGEALIASGKVGCLILAGGQASRLGITSPKGTIPVSLIKGKSLFQLFFERTLAAAKKTQVKLPIAVMTSPLNHRETEQFLQEHAWFGLLRSQVDLFPQKMLPFIDEEGNWLLEAPGKIAEGPDGNGGALHVFFHSGIWKKWHSLGIEYLQVIVIDNVLANPFDAEFIGFQKSTGAEIALKCVDRKSAEEKMGILVQRNGKIGVVEYSELSDQAFAGKNKDGSLRYSLANTSLFGLKMDWVSQVVQDPKAVLPWHLARKKSHEQMVYKCETFLFDLLPLATKVAISLYPRHLCYAPLKNASGEKNLQSVQQALLNFDREIFGNISGTPIPERAFELDPTFYYPTETLLAHWKGRLLPETSYIQPNV